MSELNLILLGKPGAGKGTQAERLKDDFGLPYIGTGDLLRKHKSEGTELGQEAQKYMDDGQLVPDELVVQMILSEVEEKGQDGFLLDGFPRTIAQADALSEALDDSGRHLTAALYIDADDDTVVKRLSGRRQCKQGHLYHVDFNKPKLEGMCELDNSPLYQRDDDQPEKVKKRLETYHRETEPLIDYYDERGLLRRFDGTRDANEVHDHIRATLATLRLEERL
jgi:adenylate kinase